MEAPQESQAPQSSIYMHAAWSGAIMGGISIALVIIFYVIDYTLLAQLKFIALIIVIAIGWMIYSGINYRKEVGGFLPFGKAWIHGFLLLVVSGLVGLVFNLILYNLVDPELPQKMADTIIANTEEMMRNFGAPEDRIDQQIAQMKGTLADQFSVGGQLWSFVKNQIGSAIFALITALFVRKNEPIEA